VAALTHRLSATRFKFAMPHHHPKFFLGALLVLLAPLPACADPETGSSSDAATTSSGESGSTSDDPGSTSDDPGSTTDDPTTTGVSGCAATHARVGWRAELVENSHGVAGTAEIVDDCTIVVSAFAYDGAGLDVRFYGALDEDYAGGFAISDDLVKPGGYVDETVVITLPPERSLDDLNSLSVWCIDVQIDFGSGVFAAP